MSTQFKILGRLAVIADGQPMALPGRKAHQLLTALLLSPNALVPVERLMDALWGYDPPSFSMENLRTYASSVRRSFGCAKQGTGLGLATSREGFRLEVPLDSLDHHVFAALTDTARSELKKEQVEAGANYLSQALALWRGEAGEGLPRDSWLGNALRALDEQRLVAAEDRAEAWLRLGRHVELVPELLRLIAAHPLRERLWYQLILAQYRSGSVGESLLTFNRARQTLVEELGISPGPELVRLQQAILHRDPELGTAVAAPTARIGNALTGASLAGSGSRLPVPRQVPAPVADFTGHQAARDAIAAALAGVDREPVAVSISGEPGVGKSALAVHALHAARDRFPDGQLYVDLRELGQPVDPREIVEMIRSLLRALGTDVPLATSVSEASSLLRSSLAERRMGMVIDNAITARQIAPLIPGYPGSAVIITGPRLVGMSGVTHSVRVDALPKTDAQTLLASCAGAGRLRCESQAVSALVDLCGGSPPVIGAVGGWLADHRQWSVQMHYDNLTVNQSALYDLRHGGVSLRAIYHRALSELSLIRPHATRLLQALSALPETFDHTCLRGVMKETPTVSVIDLVSLVDFGLVQVSAPGTYKLNGLLRGYLAGAAGA